ncbi:hypothetical protein KDH_51750 [Dictyobacter sp. S3.2.2.5]|uniref:Uncharacterized protein n=1 Tax=Dictyobacter halimunensis TaxID=3026934 RepID=A0ABQ6G0R4_9CHLR|nr:hypothetical protein KDH_51750 [Dictyobacter sp. S3.2.2.5]
MQHVHPGFAHKSDLPVENAPADVITVGSVKRKIFWPVLLVAFLLLGGCSGRRPTAISPSPPIFRCLLPFRPTHLI